MGLKWATNYCSQVHYVLKLDDDVYGVDFRPIFALLDSTNKTNSKLVQDPPQPEPIRCRDIISSPWPRRKKKSKFYVTRKEYPDEGYPNYCNGRYGYLLSQSIVKTLYQLSFENRLFSMEDVYITGILRLMAGNITLERFGY